MLSLFQQLDATGERIFYVRVFVCSDTHSLPKVCASRECRELGGQSLLVIVERMGRSAWPPRSICIGPPLPTTGFALGTSTRSSCIPTAWICQLIPGSAIAMPLPSLAPAWVAPLILGRNHQLHHSSKAFAQKRLRSLGAGVGARLISTSPQ